MSSLLMDRPDITERIRQLRVAKLAVQTQAVASSGINKQWVLDSLVKVAKRCMQEEPVLDSEGNATGEFKFDSAGATKALGLVGKELGMFVDRKDVTVRQIDQMSRAEIDAELAELERAARISASRSGRQDREGLH